MAECECGNHVSEDYYRVFSIDGELPHCPDCSTLREKTGDSMGITEV